MPIWAFANRGRRALGEWIAEPVRLLLDRHHGRLCSACFALALLLSLEEARKIVDITATLPGFRILPVTCETCGRATMALCTVPARSTEKCTHCSRSLDDGGAVVTVDGAPYHRACSAVIDTHERIHASRETSRAARTQLDRARASLDRPRPGE